MSKLYTVTLFIQLICRMLGWMNHMLESRLLGEIPTIFRYAEDTTLRAESERELHSFLMRVKEDSEKAGLKLNIQKRKIMASGPMLHGNSWEKIEVRIDFLGAPKSLQMVTAAMKLKDTCSLEGKLGQT